MSPYQGTASEVAQAAAGHLGRSFVSCYLLGSAARGDEVLGVSDLDVVIVTRGRRVIHSWEHFPPRLSFLEEFAAEARRLAEDAMAPRPPLRSKFLISTVLGRESLRKEAEGMLYFELQGAKLLAGEEVRGELRKPSWKSLDGELVESITRWRDRMIVNLSSLDVRKEPWRLASYAVMYALPTAGAYIALKKRKVILAKREIPAAFVREFPRFGSAQVLHDLLDEYLDWRKRDEDLQRLSALWLRSLKFLLEIRQSMGASQQMRSR